MEAKILGLNWARMRRWWSGRILSSPCPTDTPNQQLHLLLWKCHEDWQDKSFTASSREKPTWEKGGAKTHVGTQPSAQPTTNKRDITSKEEQRDQNPNQTTLDLRTCTGKTSPHSVWIWKSMDLTLNPPSFKNQQSLTPGEEKEDRKPSPHT